MQVHCLRPHLVLFTCSYQFWHNKFIAISANVIHQALGLVFCVQNTKVSINTVMSTFERHTLFQKREEFLLVSKAFIELNNFFKMIWMNYNVLTAKTCHAEFLSTNTCEANSFPNFRNINLLSSVECSLVLFEFYVCLGQFLIVVDALKQYFASKVEFFIETSVTTFLDISLIWL